MNVTTHIAFDEDNLMESLSTTETSEVVTTLDRFE